MLFMFVAAVTIDLLRYYYAVDYARVMREARHMMRRAKRHARGARRGEAREYDARKGVRY